MTTILTAEQALKVTELAAAPEFLAFVGQKEVQEDLGTFEMIINTATVDRSGEVVLPEGAMIENYLKNPVVLAFHDYYNFPVGKTTSLELTPAGWLAKGVFAPTGAGQTARKLFENGFLKTASVGFIPLERSTQKNVITKWELLEWSFVPVPCNPDALSLSQKEYIGSLAKEFAPEIQELKAADFDAVIQKALGFKSPEPDEAKPEPTQPQPQPEAKSGRMLSEKNRKILADCALSLENALQTLEELLSAGNSGEDTPAEPASEASKTEDNHLSTNPTKWVDKESEYRLVRGAVAILAESLRGVR